MRCCVEDEGFVAFGVALRGVASNRLMLRWLKTVVVSDEEKAHWMRHVPSSDPGGASDAAAEWRAGGAGSRSRRSSMLRRAGTAGATWSPARSGGRRTAGT